MNGDIKNAFLELAKRDYDAAKKILLSFGVDRFGDLTQSQVNAVGVLLSAPLLSEIAPELEIRQAALPKANDPYEWTGWPLFELYGLTGDGSPSKRWTRTVSLPADESIGCA